MLDTFDQWTNRECVRNLDLRVQVHPGELWVSKQRVHIDRTMYVEASKSAGAKGDVPNTYLRVRAPAAPVLTHSLTKVVLRFEGPN